ncbi:2-oxoacid:acceptor oxidoreductase family protein [Inediibacterium massiliense]|uniref:2-oxoacid:acceptor oxidoreductase family protein n=1 Tax=Inediibacterium massiliense TaxID=1658111 RepID=UPI0006B4B2F4|nr:2-oxoacid:acceptor oxidoreductase family protein [Inediibacterium massiliense]
MIEIKWLGRGGQGAFTAARLLGLSAALFENKYALAFPSFGPERRGAPVEAFTKIDDQKITDRSQSNTCDYLIVLDESLIHKDIFKDVKKDGKILINTAHVEKYQLYKDYKIKGIDATGIALKVLKRPITNTAMLGALIGISEIISLKAGIEGFKKGLSPSILDKNIEVLQRAFDCIKGGKRIE